MNLPRWTAMAALAIGVLIFSGCGRFGLSSGPTPTSPPTRTPRATFTPRPEETSTDVPTETSAPAPTVTEAPIDTAVPATRKPVATARPKPPTAIPPTQGPPPTVPPTKPPYSYLFFPLVCGNASDPAVCNNSQPGIKCSHSGSHHIDVFVASNYLDPSSVVSGIKVRYSHSAGGGKIEPDETTNYEGKAVKTLSGDLDPPGKNVGTYYAWIVDGSGNQQSDFSPPIVINAKSDSDPTNCWVAEAAFGGGH